MNEPIVRLWPGPDPTPLGDEALIEAYAPHQPAELRVNFVTSLDGAVAIDGLSAGLSGPADKRVFGVLRMRCDALLVGAGTVRDEGYRAVRLDARRRAWRTAQGRAPFPVLVVVSRSLALDPTSAPFAEAPVRPVVLTCANAPADRRTALARVADVIAVGEQDVDLGAGVQQLRERGLAELLSEGGPQLFGALTGADLVDELCLTVAPLLAGPGAGRITAGEPVAPQTLALRQLLAAGDLLLTRYGRSAGAAGP
ncbi:pyrimidine reductase family protein [Pilimelia columellifera]|uniref:pyrimidine reductase family protein n=1 Tax=Pilimelia columellifera TaxID=706574 RepID=UPI003CD0777A